MVSTENVTNCGRGLSKRLVIGEVVLVHSVEDTSLTGLHTVACIGERAGYDNGHGVFDEGLFDLLLHIDRDDLLVGIFDVEILLLFSHLTLLCGGAPAGKKDL